MRSQSCLAHLAMFLLVRRIMTQTCNTAPQPAQCCNNTSPYEAERNAYSSTAALNCSFEQDLCDYTQGCADEGMGRWEAGQGYASVSQEKSQRGSFVYSILESPPVYVSKPSRLVFTYTRTTPYQLQVFLVFTNNTSSRVEDSDSVSDNTNHTANITVEPFTGKILFRVQGGGAKDTTPPVKLYEVAILEGYFDHEASTTQPAQSPSPAAHGSAATTPTHRGQPASSDRTDQTSSVGTTMFTEDSSADMSIGALVAIIVSAIVVIFAVVVTMVLLVRRRRRKKADQNVEGPDTERTRERGGGQSEGYHGDQVRPPTHNISPAHLPQVSDPRSSDATNDYLTPVNVYDGLTNENNEHNPYDVLANQNSTYEGLSDDTRENRQYDWLFANRGQSEDYEIPDTVEASKARLAETKRTSCEYYNQPSKKERSMPLSTQAAISSAASEYQNVKPQK